MGLDLTLALRDYDHVRPLLTGGVEVPGVEWSVATEPPPVLFPKVVREQAYDVAEMSLATYTNWVDRGDCPYVGVPAFPVRRFRHRSIYVSEASSVRSPAELNGASIAVLGEYQITAATTIRGILMDRHGFDPTTVRWYTTRAESIPIDPPVEPHLVDPDREAARALVAERLKRGEIDALLSPYVPAFLGDSVRRLFPDYGTVESDYYDDTGVFPIMHLVVLRRSCHEEHPELAPALYDALCKAKAMAADSGSRDLLPWDDLSIEEARARLGEDYWGYGVAGGGRAVDALTRYAHEQGVTDGRVDATDLFVQELHDT